MIQVKEMSHEEKVTTFQLIDKAELIEMLIAANNVINQLTEVKNFRIADDNGLFPCHHNYIQKDAYWKSCPHCGVIAPLV